VPWLRAHFLDLVERSIAIASPDPHQVLEALGRMAVDIRSGRNPLAESGLVGAFASPAQLETLRSIQGMMSLLEGHGDVTMDRAARDLIPNAAHFSKVLRARRESAGGLTRLFQQLIGLEAKLRQYADGASFVREIENAGGPSSFRSLGRHPRICLAQRKSRRLTNGCHAYGVWRSSRRDSPFRHGRARPLFG